MIREDQRISKHNVLPPPRSKHHNLSNIISSQRFYALVHFLRLLLITSEPHNTELRLNLPGVNLDNPDS